MKTPRCTWNPGLVCDGKDCPMKHEAYIETVERWALVGRTAPALRWDASEGESMDKGIQERKMLAKSEIARFFDNEDLVLDWVRQGGNEAVNITRQICAELKTGNERFKAMLDARFAERNELFRGSCAEIGIEPTAKQARQWKQRKGQAFQHYRKNL